MSDSYSDGTRTIEERERPSLGADTTETLSYEEVVQQSLIDHLLDLSGRWCVCGQWTNESEESYVEHVTATIVRATAPATDDIVMAHAPRQSNADLIADAARLGYLRKDWLTCDPTYGLGVFWQKFRPDELVASDLNPAKSPVGHAVDATNTGYATGIFRAYVIDGPYKLNGRPTAEIDEKYGVDERRTRDQRHELLGEMLIEGIRCTGRDGYVLFKCQNQVEGGKVRWQEQIFSTLAERNGCRWVDTLYMPSYRAQPDGAHRREQRTARRNFSSLLVFVKERN